MRFEVLLLASLVLSGPVLANGADPTANTGEVTSAPEATPQEKPAGADTCGAEAYAELLGEPGTAAEALLIETPVRIIAFGMMVTADFVAERINFRLSEDGLIEAIYCG